MWLLCDFFNGNIVVLFGTNVLKEVRILCYLRNKSALLILMLILSSKTKLPYAILYTWKTFVADFFLWQRFSHSYFLTVPSLFIINELFLKNSKHLWKHVFTEYDIIFINSLLFRKGEFLYKVRTKLHIKIWNYVA